MLSCARRASSRLTRSSRLAIFPSLFVQSLHFLVVITIVYIYTIEMNTQTKKSSQQRKKMMKKVAGIGPFIEGSLAVTERMCGQANCPCQRGKKHKAMYLTWKEDGETRSMYVPVGRQKEALAMSQNYKKLKKLIRRLSVFHKKKLISKDR